jgi:uncharacterized membrane protein
MLSLIFVHNWKYAVFVAILVFAKLQSVSDDLYEAARVSGATKYQQFRDVTLPYIKNILFITIFLRGVWNFNLFDLIWVVTNASPQDELTTLVHTYHTLSVTAPRCVVAVARRLVVQRDVAVACGRHGRLYGPTTPLYSGSRRSHRTGVTVSRFSVRWNRRRELTPVRPYVRPRVTPMYDALGLLLQWGPHRGPHGPMGPHGGGAGAMPWDVAGTGLGPLWSLLLLVLVVALLVAGVYLVVRLAEEAATDTDDALGLLRQRYARGEIDDDEFDRRRTRLDGGPSS